MSLNFTGERIVPGAADCEPTFAQKMYQEHVARYAFAAQLANGADVLDVGCGVGYGSQLLAKAGARSVLGFDVSADAIEHARMHYYHPSTTFAVQDATLFELGSGYDLVTCFELIEHISRQDLVLDRIKMALRKDGVLAVSTPRPLEDIRTHFHVHEMTFEEIYRMLKDRFKYVESFFEVNCFTSFVGKEFPKEISNIVKVLDNFGIGHADYFVFLASDEPIEGSRSVDNLIALNDDSYVLNLEKDVGILRRAENDHIARIADLERAVAGAATLETIHHAVAKIDERLAVVTDPASEVTRLKAQVAQLEAANAEISQLQRAIHDLEPLAKRAAELDSALAAAEQSRSELDHVRRTLARASEELADSQTEAHRLREGCEQLPGLRDRVSELENEINSLRYRLNHSEATLARFRNSFSWAITRPLRWLWRASRRLSGRSLPQ